MTKSFAIGASLLAFAVAVPANAAFMLDTNGGTGSVTPTANGFVLTGSDGGTGFPVSTTYTDVAVATQTIVFRWRYTTFDSPGNDDPDFAGSTYDPAGFLVNNVFTQLSTDGQLFGSTTSGLASFNVGANQNFGFYINSVDDLAGPGQLQISLGIPEPATWAFMILGFGFIGGAMRYSKRTTKVAFA